VHDDVPAVVSAGDGVCGVRSSEGSLSGQRRFCRSRQRGRSCHENPPGDCGQCIRFEKLCHPQKASNEYQKKPGYLAKFRKVSGCRLVAGVPHAGVAVRAVAAVDLRVVAAVIAVWILGRVAGSLERLFGFDLFGRALDGSFLFRHDASFDSW